MIPTPLYCWRIVRHLCLLAEYGTEAHWLEVQHYWYSKRPSR